MTTKTKMKINHQGSVKFVQKSFKEPYILMSRSKENHSKYDLEKEEESKNDLNYLVNQHPDEEEEEEDNEDYDDEDSEDEDEDEEEDEEEDKKS